MMKFDWRRFEQADDLRKDHWPEHTPTNLHQIYDSNMNGYSAWRGLIGRLSDISAGATESEITKSLAAALDQFLDDTTASALRPVQKCVFISHQRRDTADGERVACLTDHHGLGYWLDVHDPTLALANQLPQNDPRRSVIIAARIEMALLNSSHVIALHTANSLSSQWVPYEFGRAKARKIAASNAAGWFKSPQTPAAFGDYVQLAIMTYDEPDVTRWLNDAAGGGPQPAPVSAYCSTHKSNRLS